MTCDPLRPRRVVDYPTRASNGRPLRRRGSIRADDSEVRAPRTRVRRESLNTHPEPIMRVCFGPRWNSSSVIADDTRSPRVRVRSDLWKVETTTDSHVANGSTRRPKPAVETCAVSAVCTRPLVHDPVSADDSVPGRPTPLGRVHTCPWSSPQRKGAELVVAVCVTGLTPVTCPCLEYGSVAPEPLVLFIA